MGGPRQLCLAANTQSMMMLVVAVRISIVDSQKHDFGCQSKIVRELIIYNDNADGNEDEYLGWVGGEGGWGGLVIAYGSLKRKLIIADREVT